MDIIPARSYLSRENHSRFWKQIGRYSYALYCAKFKDTCSHSKWYQTYHSTQMSRHVQHPHGRRMLHNYLHLGGMVMYIFSFECTKVSKFATSRLAIRLSTGLVTTTQKHTTSNWATIALSPLPPKQLCPLPPGNSWRGPRSWPRRFLCPMSSYARCPAPGLCFSLSVLLFGMPMHTPSKNIEKGGALILGGRRLITIPNNLRTVDSRCRIEAGKEVKSMWGDVPHKSK